MCAPPPSTPAKRASSETNALLVSNVDTPGKVRICCASSEILRSKRLFNIEFEVVGNDVSQLSFQNVEFYSPNGRILDGLKIDGKFESWDIPADHTALLQNYPNPFNPETWIPYQLKEASEVTIRIYSSLGELVREFDLGHKSAGFYADRDRALYWDGKNKSGEEVSSGVYFYNIQTDGFSAVRKMTISK